MESRIEDIHQAYHYIIRPDRFFEGWSDAEFTEWVDDCSSEKVLLSLYDVLVEYDLNHFADLLISKLSVFSAKNIKDAKE